MYNAKKVKQWIKKEGKHNLLYNAEEGFVSDTFIMIRATDDMKPALLEVFGEPGSGFVRGGVVNNGAVHKMSTLWETSGEAVIDSQLLKIATRKDGKKTITNLYRIFYQPGSGRKIMLNQRLLDLLGNIDGLTFLAPEGYGQVSVLQDGELIAIMAQVQDHTGFLDSFELSA